MAVARSGHRAPRCTSDLIDRHAIAAREVHSVDAARVARVDGLGLFVIRAVAAPAEHRAGSQRDEHEQKDQETELLRTGRHVVESLKCEVSSLKSHVTFTNQLET